MRKTFPLFEAEEGRGKKNMFSFVTYLPIILIVKIKYRFNINLEQSGYEQQLLIFKKKKRRKNFLNAFFGDIHLFKYEFTVLIR